MKEIQRVQAERMPSGLAVRLRMVGLTFFLMAALVAVLMLALAVPLAAASPTQAVMMTYAVAGIDLGIVLLLTGVIFILVGIGISRATMGAHPMAAGGSVIIGIVALVILAVYVLVPAGAPSNTNTNGIPQSTYVLLASVDTALGSSSAPGSPYSSTNTVVGGTTALWSASEGTFDSTSNTFTAREHVNTAVAVGALFMDPLAFSMKFTATLKTPYTAPATGTAYTYTYGMVIDSISRTTLNQDNLTASSNLCSGCNVFYRDATSATSGGDYYLLYKNNGGTWMAACPEWRGAQTLGSSCGFQALGGESAVSSTDTFYFYIVMNQMGFAGYTNPSVGSQLTIHFHFGSSDNSLVSQAFTLNIVLNARDTTANT